MTMTAMNWEQRLKRRKEICKLYAKGWTQIALAKQFKVSQQLISYAWKHDATEAQIARRKRYLDKQNGKGR